MANLLDLCKDVPFAIRLQRENILYWEKRQRKNAKVIHERNIFETCKNERPQRKYRNRLSSEQMGRCKRTYITDVRFGGSYIHVATRGTYITELR